MGSGAFSKHTTNIQDIPPISRQALGRIAWLGDLYDATTDRFCGVSIFQDKLLADSPAVRKTDNPYSNSKYITANNLEEKFHELNVTGELRLSVLAGMCELGGSAKYLGQDKTSFKSVESTQLWHIKTATEHLEINKAKQYKPISQKVMSRLGATHVVTEIEWGAKCVITAREETRTIKKKKEAQGGLFAWAWSKAKTMLGGDNTNEETEERTDTIVEILGDVLPDGGLPQTLEGAQAMMRNLPQTIKNCNEGKGKPLTYIMSPISHLVSTKPSPPLKTFRSVDDAICLKVVRLFDAITESSQEVCVKQELRKLLEKVRSATEDVECLDAFCDKHLKITE